MPSFRWDRTLTRRVAVTYSTTEPRQRLLACSGKMPYKHALAREETHDETCPPRVHTVHCIRISNLDVSAIYRLPARPGNIPGVIVRFIRQTTRDQWFENIHKLKVNNSSVFILENLTSRNKHLLGMVKEWAKEKGTVTRGAEMERYF